MRCSWFEVSIHVVSRDCCCFDVAHIMCTSTGNSVLDYFDEETKEKFIPHGECFLLVGSLGSTLALLFSPLIHRKVIEPSLGVDRLILALICSAYAETRSTARSATTSRSIRRLRR